MKNIAVKFGYFGSVVGRIINDYKRRGKEERQQAQQLSNLEKIRRLKAENKELKKRGRFLKKQRCFSRRYEQGEVAEKLVIAVKLKSRDRYRRNSSECWADERENRKVKGNIHESQ